MTRKRRSGFAMVIAIFLLSLVAMTLTALSAAIIAEARRTQIQGEGAQLRQLLHAGADRASGIAFPGLGQRAFARNTSRFPAAIRGWTDHCRSVNSLL